MAASETIAAWGSVAGAAATLAIALLAWRQSHIAERTLRVIEGQESRLSRPVKLRIDEYHAAREGGAGERHIAVLISLINPADTSAAAVDAKLLISYRRDMLPIEVGLPWSTDYKPDGRTALELPLRVSPSDAAVGWLCFAEPGGLLAAAEVDRYLLEVEMSDGLHLTGELGILTERGNA